MAIAQKQRFYIHGDRYELDHDRYYCAECDVFFGEAHFSSSHREDHFSRYAVAAKSINKHLKGSKEHFRPESPENLFA